MARFAMSIDPNWGVPLKIYLERGENLAIRQYPLERVLSAIKVITTKGLGEIISDTTLEAFLSVVYYPERLRLLNAEGFRDIWFTLMENYIAVYSLYDRSFGFLMTQVLGLVTAVGFLAHNKKLESFINDTLVLKAITGSEILRLLTLQVLQVTKLDVQSLATMFGRGAKFRQPPFDNATAGSYLPNIGCLTTNTTTFLIKHFFDSRDKLLLASHRAPACGWPLVLLVMWLIMIHSPYYPEEEEAYASQLAAIREVAYRYSLVSTPEERPTMEVLIKESTRRIVSGFEAPVNSDDARIVVSTFIHQTSRAEDSAPRSLYCLAMLSAHAASAIEKSFVYDVYPSFLEAAFNRLWLELPDDPLSKLSMEACSELMVYANLHIQHARDCLNLKRTNILKAVHSLVRVDLVSLLGRLIIVHAAVEGTARSTTLRSAEMLSLISSLSKSLLKHDDQSRSELLPLYSDWTKICSRISYMQTTKPSPTSLDQMNTIWLEFGGALGYLDLYQHHAYCANSRCAIVDVILSKSSVCAECSDAMYCSLRCQNQDWIRGPTPHRITCQIVARLKDAKYI
ncbi:hypothetical protein BDV93DRAFT_607685 [Ceratobasidium sp. AG-I]|nr:hypothetical protein BDV93DRAFT_607685 [Ceratobasidium sp. AG-I]